MPNVTVVQSQSGSRSVRLRLARSPLGPAARHRSPGGDTVGPQLPGERGSADPTGPDNGLSTVGRRHDAHRPPLSPQGRCRGRPMCGEAVSGPRRKGRLRASPEASDKRHPLVSRQPAAPARRRRVTPGTTRRRPSFVSLRRRSRQLPPNGDRRPQISLASQRSQTIQVDEDDAKRRIPSQAGSPRR